MAQILLKRPYTPVVFTSATKEFNVYGKSFMRLQAVYLSGAPYNNQTFYNPFSAVPKLSAQYPGFTARKLLSSEYTTNYDNIITFNMPSAVNAGYVDIIVQNPAGYGTLTQYVIKDLYTGLQDLSTIRPWALGIKVLSGVVIPPPPPTIKLLTMEDNHLLKTIDGQSYIIAIKPFY